MTFTIRNNGTAELTLTLPEKVEIGGADAGEFSLTQAPDASVPAGGGATTFAVTFSPANEGNKSVTVAIGTDLPVNESISFTLAGSGVKGWRLVGSAGFSAGAADYVSLAVDAADGTPYVAYVDQSINDGYPQVQVFASGAWSALADPGDPLVTDAYYYTPSSSRTTFPTSRTRTQMISTRCGSCLTIRD